MTMRKQMPTIQELRQICRPNVNKGGISVMAFYEAYNPYVSIYATWFFVKLGLSANVVNWTMILCSVIGAVLIVPDAFWVRVIGVFFFLLGYLLDWTDGEVARFHFHERKDIPEKEKRIASIKGAYIDKVYHHLTSVFLLLAIGVNTANAYDDQRILFGALIVVLLLLLKLVVQYAAFASVFVFLGVHDKLSFRATDQKKYETEVYLTKKQRNRQRWVGTHGILKMYLMLLVVLFGPLVQLGAITVYGLFLFLTVLKGLARKGYKTVEQEFNRFTITE